MPRIAAVGASDAAVATQTADKGDIKDPSLSNVPFHKPSRGGKGARGGRGGRGGARGGSAGMRRVDPLKGGKISFNKKSK